MKRPDPRRREPIDILLVGSDSEEARRFDEGFDESGVPYRLHHVSGGAAALEFVDGGGDDEEPPRPDIVILDLPDRRSDGYELLETLKNEPELKLVPVLVVSSSESADDVARSYTLHANAHVRKPDAPERFEEFVRSLARFWLRSVQLPPAN